MPFEFPYTDLHEINLNKFIKAVKNLLGGHGGELLQKQSNIPFDYAWKPVTGLSAVNSVNGMTGNVTLTAADVGAIPNTTPIPEPANNLPADLGVPYRGTSLKYARMDHVHKMPTASDVGALPVGTTIPLPGLNAPADLGTAYRGTATRYSREDHVHNMPSASDVGALPDSTQIPQPANNLPSDLGTANRGNSTRYSREDHVHNMPNPIIKIVTYSGTDLSTIFPNASALHDAITAGDFSNIHIGDYWPITISGSYKDVAKFTVPSGITYYNDANLTTVGGTTSTSYEGTYQSSSAIKFWIGGTAKYCAKGDCTPTYIVPINVNLKMEVASINPYIGTGDTEFSANHVLLCSRELLNRFQMRVDSNTWYDTTKTNPWRGSHLWETLNNATDGVIKLVESTTLGPYVYLGPNNQGMRAYLPTMAPGAANPTGGSWNDRGRLFIPTEMEAYGSPAGSQAGGYLGTYQAEELFNQWPLFQGTSRHLVKTLGNHGRTQWWLQNAINANTFCTISHTGIATTYSAGTAYGVPLCFLIT